MDDEEGPQLVDGRAGDISCRIDKQRHYKDGVNLDLICQHGQEPPYNFRTEYSLLLTPARTLMVTNNFVDQKPEALEYVRCLKKDLPIPPTVYVLPPLREGEFYEGQAYPATYSERRAELLGAGAKPLKRTEADRCTFISCGKFPEIRSCENNGAYCVGRWETKAGATVDYVFKPDSLEMLKIVCRDTCGFDEIRPPAR